MRWVIRFDRPRGSFLLSMRLFRRPSGFLMSKQLIDVIAGQSVFIHPEQAIGPVTRQNANILLRCTRIALKWPEETQ